MSKDAFTRFLDKLGSDEDLRRAMEDRFGGLSGKVPADDLIGFAEEQGYSFTVEEASGELTDAELEGVTGGISYLKFDSAQTYEELKVEWSPQTNTFDFTTF